MIIGILFSSMVYAQFMTGNISPNPAANLTRDMLLYGARHAPQFINIKRELKSDKKYLAKNQQKLKEIEKKIDALKAENNPENSDKLERLNKRREKINFQIFGFTTLIKQREEQIKKDSIATILYKQNQESMEKLKKEKRNKEKKEQQ